jgi:hypothetical protein
MTQKLEIFPNYTNRSLENLSTYKYCDDDDSCLMYMFKNGDNIYYELDLYNKIPKQVENDKISNIFNTNNIIKTNLLNDGYISTIRTKYNVDNDFIINSILMHLRPILFSNTNITQQNVDQIKANVENTMQFELNYMNTIENQIEFIMSNSTKQHIRKKINEKINDLEIEVKDDYIKSMLIHEINNFRGRYGNNTTKITPVEVSNIYINSLSKLKPRDVFSIISDVIERIVSNLRIENNMIKNNNKLDKWNTILGDNNKHGLRRHTYIKLNEKKPKGMLFNMTF